jgi:type III secretory pathway lipoprotein EscJ
MIPFVRYVLRKAQKYGLDVHILLECIKNSTESQLLARYAQIKDFLSKSVKGFEQPIAGIDVIIKKRESQKVSSAVSQGSMSDNGASSQQSPSIFPMRTVIAWLNELSMLHKISKLSISMKDQHSALLLTDCSNFSICQSIRILNL